MTPSLPGLLATSRSLHHDVHALNLLAANGRLPCPSLLTRVNELSEQLEVSLHESQLVLRPAEREAARERARQAWEQVQTPLEELRVLLERQAARR